MRVFSPMFLLTSLLLLAVVPAVGIGAEPNGIDFFEKKVRPLLVEHCYGCHSVASGKSKGNLLLDSRAGLLKGGDSGPGAVAGEPDKSLIIRAVRGTEPKLRMPPKGGLTEAQIADLSNWVRMGLPDPRVSTAKPVVTADVEKARSFWSLRPVAEPIAPPVKDPNWPRTAIDRFALARMESHGLSPVADADRRTLLRRATFDLIGLPPTPEESAAFLADQSPAAFAAVVDRLLASPHYGERWGRHWLVPRPD